MTRNRRYIFFSKLFKNILRIIAIVLIIIAIVYLIAVLLIAAGALLPASAAVLLPAAAAGLGAWGVGLGLAIVATGAIALANVIDHDTATKTFSNITSGLASAGRDVVRGAGTILNEVVDQAGRIASTGLSAFAIPLIIVGGFFLYKNRSKTGDVQKTKEPYVSND